VKIKSTFFAIGGLALLMIAFPVNAQVFLGDSEDNLFQGSATGHDRFFGRRGEDLISYDGMITSYGFELRSSGRIRVHKSNGDFDVLDDIERVKFEGEVYELNEILSVIGFQTGVIIYHGTTGLDSFQGDTTGEACYYGDRRYDRVFYEGVLQQYSFTELPDGTVSVIKPSGDVDILNSIEAVRFDEETQARDIEDLTAQATDVSEPTLEERQEVIFPTLTLALKLTPAPFSFRQKIQINSFIMAKPSIWLAQISRGVITPVFHPISAQATALEIRIQT